MSLRAFRGLRLQLLLWTILPLTAVLVIISFTGVYSHQQAMRALVEQRDTRLAMVAAELLGERLAGRAVLLRAWADELAAGAPASRPPASVQEAFDQGVAILRGGQLHPLDQASQAWSEHGWLAGQLGDLVIRFGHPQYALVPSTHQPGDQLAFIAASSSDGTLAVIGAVSPERLRLRTLMSALVASPRVTAFVVNAEGRVLWHPDPEGIGQDLSSDPEVQAVIQGVAGATYHRNPDGTEFAVGYAPITPVGWGLIIQEPWGDVVGPMMQYSLVTPVILVAALVVSMLAIYFGVQRIIRPLQELDQQASRVAWGDYTATQADLGGIQEIEDLRRTLNEMARRIRSYQTAMRDYVAAITMGQEEERKRLARELHDDTAQSLVALSQKLEIAQKALYQDPGKAGAQLAELRAMTADILANVRQFSRDLRPVYLEDLGLVPALEMLVQEVGERNGIESELRIRGIPQRLSPDLELAIYRIVQEALNNVSRHAHARHVVVEATFQTDGISVAVEDDGVGFQVPESPDALARAGHFGLMGIRERALLFGGRVTITSQPGAGTRLVVHLPFSASSGA